jgi:hypothetical protein
MMSRTSPGRASAEPHARGDADPKIGPSPSTPKAGALWINFRARTGQKARGLPDDDGPVPDGERAGFLRRRHRRGEGALRHPLDVLGTAGVLDVEDDRAHGVLNM